MGNSDWSEEEYIPKKKAIEDINKNDPRYILLLAFLNCILETLNKEKINDIDEFRNVNENDILGIENINELLGMELDILRVFDKKEILWHNRKRTKTYVFTFIKRACEIFHCCFGKSYDVKLKGYFVCGINSYLKE